MITPERLRFLLRYSKRTGFFTWRVPVGKALAGSRAGTVSHGYIAIGLDGHKYRAHRLAVLWVKGYWPAHEVDHRNNIRSDNRWTNLREATHIQNLQNQTAPQSNNTSGYRGVHWCNTYKAWIAKIKVNGRTVALGRFDSAEVAYSAYVAAQGKYHPFSRTTVKGDS